MLYREPMWLKCTAVIHARRASSVSVLYREPMWLKCGAAGARPSAGGVSVLYREPMWLKLSSSSLVRIVSSCFSALP